MAYFVPCDLVHPGISATLSAINEPKACDAHPSRSEGCPAWAEGSADDGCDSGALYWRRRCSDYRARIRRRRLQFVRGHVAHVVECIERLDRLGQTVLEESLSALVTQTAMVVVERVFSSVPDAIALAIAERAQGVTAEVLGGESGVIARAHPSDIVVAMRHGGTAANWQWEYDEERPRGEIQLRLSSGTVTIRWRDLVSGVLKEAEYGA